MTPYQAWREELRKHLAEWAVTHPRPERADYPDIRPYMHATRAWQAAWHAEQSLWQKLHPAPTHTPDEDETKLLHLHRLLAGKE